MTRQILSLFLLTLMSAPADAFPKKGERLTDAQVTALARLALEGIPTEYPNKPSEVLVDDASLRTPRTMHPAFFGSFDWHSSVHGHWMLVRLLRLYPESPVAAEIETLLDRQLTPENMRKEAAYFTETKFNKAFERMYGWAWALRLATELRAWDDPRARRWSDAFTPLENTIVTLTKDYLPKLTWPVRTGVHPDTGFALAFTLDYARVAKDSDLEKLVVERARAFYGKDRDYPTAYEPSGQDFFSSGLNEADLMRRVLPPAEFAPWLTAFLPDLAKGQAGNLLTPVEVSDVTDGQLVHLAGLNLSRAWTFSGLASALPAGDPRVPILTNAAAAHLDAGFRYVFSGHYEGEHWLATFAVYALTE
jgi:hypothetical protein